jgi:hypothetical protein
VEQGVTLEEGLPDDLIIVGGGGCDRKLGSAEHPGGGFAPAMAWRKSDRKAREKLLSASGQLVGDGARRAISWGAVWCEIVPV